MKDKSSSDNWDLEEGGRLDDRWVLRESEQRASDQWDLQTDEEPVSEWQPVQYDRPQRSRIIWIFPILITLALFAVIVYGAFILIPRFFGDDPAETGPTPPIVAASTDTPVPETEIAQAPTEEAPVIVDAETPGAGTVVAPGVGEGTPTIDPEAPTPQAVVQVEFATVSTPYGVNARTAPNTDAPIIRLLEQGQTFLVFGESGTEWLEIFVNDSQLAPGLPIAGQIGFAAAEFFTRSQQVLPESFYQDILASVGRLPTPVEEPPTPETEQAETPAAEIPLLPTPTPSPTPTVGVSGVQTGTSALSLTVTISAVNGLNVRTRPDLTSEAIGLLPNGATVPGIGRSLDNSWVLLQLEEGPVGWVAGEFVVVSGDVNTLPPVLPEPPADATPTPTPEPPTPTPDPNAVVEPPAPYTAELPPDTPGILVVGAGGVNVRADPIPDGPVLTVAPNGAALPANARSADSQWLRIELPDGTLGWVATVAVLPQGDVASLPVADAEPAPPTTTGGVPTATPVTDAAPTPTPTSQTTDQSTDQTSSTGVATVRSIVSNLYAAPGTDSETVGTVARGNELPASGRTSDGEWVQVTSGGRTAWIAARSVTLDVDVATLPIVP